MNAVAALTHRQSSPCVVVQLACSSIPEKWERATNAKKRRKKRNEIVKEKSSLLEECVCHLGAGSFTELPSLCRAAGGSRVGGGLAALQQLHSIVNAT